jgi:hypothetical protein
VEPAFLNSAFEAIKQRHGSTAAYLVDVLGITPEVRAALAAQLIVPATSAARPL